MYINQINLEILIQGCDHMTDMFLGLPELCDVQLGSQAKNKMLGITD